jgi:serine/threonine-protein kinase RsbW
MFLTNKGVCPQDLVPQDGAWYRASVHSVEDMQRTIESIVTSMTAAGFPEKDVRRLHLALEEGIINAHKHGHQGDWSKPVTVRYSVTEAGRVAEIEDQGRGFDPGEVADPLAPENLERSSGRGLLLMRT